MSDPRVMAERLLLKVLENDPDQDYRLAVTRAANLAYTGLVDSGASKAAATRVGGYVMRIGVELAADLLPTVHPELTRRPADDPTH